MKSSRTRQCPLSFFWRETSCDIILFVFLWILFCVAVGVVGCCCSSPRGHTCTLGCSLFTTHVDGSNAPGTLEEEYLRWWLLVSLTSRPLTGKSLSANLEELSSPDPNPVGAAGFEKNSSGVGQAAAAAQMASNQNICLLFENQVVSTVLFRDGPSPPVPKTLSNIYSL